MKAYVLKCGNCESATKLSVEASILRRLGLYPFRCPACEVLRPHIRMEGEEWLMTGLENEV